MAFELLREQIPETEEPSLGQEIKRHAGRTAARIGENIAGAPGDILSLINEYIAGPAATAITGEEQIPYEELEISKVLPTSEKLKAGHEKEFGEAVKPQNKVESFFDDVVSTATSIFSPGATLKRGVGLGKNVLSSLFKSVGAHTAKETVKDFTGSEEKGVAAQIGALTLLSFIDKKGAAKAISEGYKPLEARAASLLPVSANKLENTLSNLKSKMQKGTQAPSEKFIIDEVDAVLDKIKNGKITPEEAWASKRSLNEKLSKVLFDTPYKSQPRARKLASIIGSELDDALALTKSQDPSFYKDLKGWNTAYKAMADSNVVSKWVEKNLKYTPMSVGLLNMFGGTIGAVAGTAALPYQAIKTSYRIAKSPKLASHYSKALGLAFSEDAVSFNKQLKLLDKEIQNDENKDRWKIVD